MDGIVAVAFLVGCASNLLICEDLPTPQDHFPDMVACRAALPGLVRHHQTRDHTLPVVMGKCNLMLRPGPSTASTSVLAASMR